MGHERHGIHGRQEGTLGLGRGRLIGTRGRHVGRRQRLMDMPSALYAAAHDRITTPPAEDDASVPGRRLLHARWGCLSMH